jgi:hypothetical protein
MDMAGANRGAGQAMLEELYVRARQAYNVLDQLITNEAKYHHYKLEKIIRVFGLEPKEAYWVLDFAEKIILLLENSFSYMDFKLRQLLMNLERHNVKIQPSPQGKTLYIVSQETRIDAEYLDGEWLFRLPIYTKTHCKFPDILKLNTETLRYLQLGWRASDETTDGNIPVMVTTKSWQMYAWAAVRYGAFTVYLSYLNLNKNNPSLRWDLRAISWNKQWLTENVDKKVAQVLAEQKLLSLLTWYLGDGGKHKSALVITTGKGAKYFSKEVAEKIVEYAYSIKYGTLLDLLESDKWSALKALHPKENPVHAEYDGYTFWLLYSKRSKRLQARAFFKDQSEANGLKQKLLSQNIKATVFKRPEGYILQLSTHAILKLAEHPEWRKALKELILKKRIRPETPTLRRLLELAEYPPPKNLISAMFLSFRGRSAIKWRNGLGRRGIRKPCKDGRSPAWKDAWHG